MKAGVNVHALASQCTVLQSAYFLSCQRFHDYNCLQCPQQKCATTQAHKHALKSPWLWVAAFY